MNTDQSVQILHISATPEFKSDKEKMALINKMCELAGNKIKKTKKGKKKL